MDINLIYGILTAASAISAGFAGAQSARLSKKAIDSVIAIREASTTSSTANRQRIWKEVSDTVAEQCAGAQTASAWLATATALFGVASTRPNEDVLGIIFLVIGVILASLAVRALLAANASATLIPARAAFEEWYPRWVKKRDLGHLEPSDDEVAFAFEKEHKKYAAKLRRFQVWPFHWAGYRAAESHVSHAR